jgi:glycosyltransferase involved in cell wall biosynthesis
MTNYQHWHGFDDPKYGYGRQTTGFINHLPPGVKLDSRASVSVWHGQPQYNKGWYKGQYRACFTMFETDKVPAEVTRYLPLFDQIIVPCDHNVELFSRYHKNVIKVQEGVDLTLFKPTSAPRLDRFQFRAGGSCWARKGIDITIAAFRKLNLPDADLRIKISPAARDIPTNTDFGPNVYLDQGWMTDEEQLLWFAQADCFVAASRGEGWGLMPLQTIAMGIPTIVSLSTGHLEFSHLATGHIPCGTSKSFLGGNWDEPDVNALADLMLDHYTNLTKKKAEAAKNVKGCKQFTWDIACQQLVAALPEGHLLKTKEWQPMTVDIPVRALRPIIADIGKNRYVQKRGDIFTVTEGAYQTLHDSGAVVLAHDD